MEQTIKKQVFKTCTLKDLCPDDKQKVAKLVKQVVELGRKIEQLKEAANKAAENAAARVKQLQECNKGAVQENCSLKAKLGQAVTVLRMYHHKVQGLDAALRAVQQSTNTVSNAVGQQQQHCPNKATTGEDVQQSQQSHQQQDGADGSGQVQTNHHVAASSTSTAAAAEAADKAISASVAAAKLHQDARSLSQALAGAKPTTDDAEAAPRSGSINCQQPLQRAAGTSQEAAGIAGTAVVHSAVTGSELSLVTAGLSADSSAQPQLPLSYIMSGQKLLQFDPSIGSQGAFIILDCPGNSSPTLLGTQIVQPAFAASMPGSETAAVAAVDGLGDAAPWQSPTCKQLLSLANACYSLALPPTATRAQTLVCNSSSSTANSTHKGSAQGPAASNSNYTTSGAVAGSTAAAGSGSRLGVSGAAPVAPACEAGGVQEVPVDAVDGRKVPVLVQNEKSSTSLLSIAPSYPGNGTEEHSAVQHQQQHWMQHPQLWQQEHPQVHQHMVQQQLAHQIGHQVQDVPSMSCAMSHPDVLAGSGRGGLDHYGSCSTSAVDVHNPSWQQGLPDMHALPLLQQPGWQQQEQQHDAQQVGPAHIPGALQWQVLQQMHTAIPIQQDGQLQAQQCTLQNPEPAEQRSSDHWVSSSRGVGHGHQQQQRHEPPAVQHNQHHSEQYTDIKTLQHAQGGCNWHSQLVPTQQQKHLQQAAQQAQQPQQQQVPIFQGCVTSAAQYCDVVPTYVRDSDAAELLERFDESLLDLLVEVERLEQQQQQCKQKLQQDHGHHHTQPQLSECGRSSLSGRQTVLAIHQQFAPGRHNGLPHPWRQRQQQATNCPRQQFQRHSKARNKHVVQLGEASNYYAGGMEWKRDVEVLSDILNHLD